jgi:WD40 repeat protein
VAFSPDGRVLATGEGMDTGGRVVLRGAADGREQSSWAAHAADVFALAFSPDGMALATCGKDREAKVRDLASGEERAVLRQETGWVRSLAFSPDGRVLALACGDFEPKPGNPSWGDVRLWDAAAGKEGPPLRAGKAFLMAVAFSPDGKALAAAGEDGKIVVWERLSP